MEFFEEIVDSSAKYPKMHRDDAASATISHILRYDLLSNREFRRQVLAALEIQSKLDVKPKSVWTTFHALAQAYLTDTIIAVSDIHLLSGISRSSAGRGLDALEQANAIIREDDKKDRRRKLLRLTKSFTDLLDQYVDHCFAEFGELIALRENRARRKSEQALRESRALIEAIFESSMDCIVTISASGKIIEFNPAAEKVFGIRRDLAIGQLMENLLIPENLRQHHRQAMHSKLSLDQPYENQRVETRARRADGSEFPVELTITRIQIGGEPVFNAFVRDMSEAKELEKNRFMAQRLDAIGQLTGGVAHEFNNILQAIVSNLHLLTDYIGDNPAANEIIERASTAVFRGGSLTDNLLAYSRKQMLNPEIIEIADLLPDINSAAAAAGIPNDNIRNQILKSLPAIQVDRNSLTHSVVELLKNAQSASTGNSTIEVLFKGVQVDKDSELGSGHFLSIEVQDRGAGMSEEVRRRATEPFFTTKDIGQGEGLGLSVAYGFASQSGGTLRIKSKAGQGTTAELLFPAI